MRVIQVMAGAPNGGAETAFEDISLALSAAGITQKIIIRGNNKARVQKFKDAGIDVEILPFGGIFDFYTPWKIKKAIADFKPQIVQTWMSRATSKTPSSANPKSYLKVARLGGYYGLKYFRGTDFFVANTGDIRDYLVREGINEEKVATIHNFAPEEKVNAPLTKRDLQTPDEAIVLLSLARYHSAKALDVLIKSVIDVKTVHVWLAGEGPEESSLKKLAIDSGVADRIHFLGWRSDRAALLQAADICVFPSRFEPFGNVVVQAWAQKTPLICSKSQGPLQYVRDGEDALMFDIDDVEQLSEKIVLLIADKDLSARFVERGYQRYKSEFSKEKIVGDYLNFYQKIIKENLTDVSSS
jgi:glycosyltransferase involved in cell wall biosynthesis